MTKNKEINLDTKATRKGRAAAFESLKAIREILQNATDIPDDYRESRNEYLDEKYSR